LNAKAQLQYSNTTILQNHDFARVTRKNFGLDQSF
jgi:hypothetical protein